MTLRPRPVLRSAVFALVAGVILWPPVPELLYWSAFDWLGDAVVVPVLAASVAVGAGFGALTAISWRSFAVGGTLAYLLGMVGVQAVLAPEGPVHLLLYGTVLIGVVAGVAISTASKRATGGATGGDNTPGG